MPIQQTQMLRTPPIMLTPGLQQKWSLLTNYSALRPENIIPILLEIEFFTNSEDRSDLREAAISRFHQSFGVYNLDGGNNIVTASHLVLALQQNPPFLLRDYHNGVDPFGRNTAWVTAKRREFTNFYHMAGAVIHQTYEHILKLYQTNHNLIHLFDGLKRRYPVVKITMINLNRDGSVDCEVGAPNDLPPTLVDFNISQSPSQTCY